MKKLPETNLAGLKISCLTFAETVSHLRRAVSLRFTHEKKGKLISKSEANFWGKTDRAEHPAHTALLVVTPNPEMFLFAHQDPEFMKLLNSADLSTADGTGLLWASKFLSLPPRGWLGTKLQKWRTLFFGFLWPRSLRKIIPERVSGSDLFLALAKLAEKKGWSFFLLGGWEGVAEECAASLKKQFPKLKIAGTHMGSPDPADDRRTRLLVRRASPDFLFVAYGAPKQEKWLTRNLPYLPSVKCAAGIGGTFDFVSGRTPRAPLGLRLIGLEWFWRLLLQPRARFSRIYNAVFVFPSVIERIKRLSSRS